MPDRPRTPPPPRKLREPAPDEQGRPTKEAGGPVPLDRRQREQRGPKSVLREDH